MSDLRKLTYYLGIKVKKEENGITINQEVEAKLILKEAALQECNPTHIPKEPGMKLSKAEDEPEIDLTQYRKVVGCLRYLLETGPDMTFGKIYKLIRAESKRIS